MNQYPIILLVHCNEEKRSYFLLSNFRIKLRSIDELNFVVNSGLPYSNMY